MPPQEPEILGQPPDGIDPVVESFTYTCYRLRFRVVGILARNCKKLKAEFRASTKPLSSREEFRARRKRIDFDTKVGIQGLFRKGQLLVNARVH